MSPLASGPHVVLSLLSSSRICFFHPFDSSAAYLPTWRIFFVLSLPPRSPVGSSCSPPFLDGLRPSLLSTPLPRLSPFPSFCHALSFRPWSRDPPVRTRIVSACPWFRVSFVRMGPSRTGACRHVGTCGGGGGEREGQASRERGGEMAMAWTVGWWTTNPTERRLLPHPGAHETRPTYPAKKTGARGVRKMAEHGMGKEEMESPRSGGAGDTTQRIIAKLMREASYSGATGEALMDLHHQQRWKEKELDASPRSTTSSDDVKNWCVRRLRPPPPPRGAKRNAIRRRSARSERVEHRARVPHPTSGGNGPMRSVLVRSIRSNRSQRLEPNVGERVGSNRNQPTIQRTQDESHCEHGEHRDWHDGLTEEQRRRVDRAGTWEDTKTTISKISDIASMP